jgi:hypothetical protein
VVGPVAPGGSGSVRPVGETEQEGGVKRLAVERVTACLVYVGLD